MQDRSATLENLHTRAQQPLVVAAPGVEHQPRIGAARQDQAHVHAARGSRFERGQQLRVGHEVGIGQPHARLGAGNGREQGGVDLAEGLVRRAGNGAHHQLAHRLGARKVILCRERFATLLLPCRQEYLLQLGHHRALQLQVGVAPARVCHFAVFVNRLRAHLPARRAAGVHAADVDAAEKGGAPVHDQQLAVVALIQRPVLAGGQRVDRVELQHTNATLGQPLEKVGWRCDRADAVANEVYLHALPLLGDQGLRKLVAHVVGLQNVGFHVDVVARGGDCGQHRAVSDWAVLQQQHLVAGGQRAADDRLFERQVTVEDVGVLAAAFQPLQHRLALSLGERAARPFDQQRRAGAARHVGHDGGQAAATGQPDRSHCQASALQGHGAALTRQTTLPTSSATSSAPALSSATPTGRPRALPPSLRKPVNTSTGAAPVGRPLANGTKTTL